MSRAPSSGIRLSANDAAQVRGMIDRGDRHHDIAAWFGVNQGRIAEVKDETLHPGVLAAPEDELPPPGPYSSGKSAHRAIEALEAAKDALQQALSDIDDALSEIQ